MAQVHKALTLILVALSIPAATHQTPAHAARQAQGPTVDALSARKGHDAIGLRGHGFVRDSGGGFTTIDAPRADFFTVVFGLDDTGRSVGSYVDRRGRLRGFVREQDRFATIDYPGARATFIARANDHGQVVGGYSENANDVATDLPHGFLLEDGTFTRIDVPGAQRTQAFGINNHGHIVGRYLDDAGVNHGFLLADGVFTTIDVPPGAFTLAFDINDGGEIVGIGGAFNAPRGFIRGADGTFTAIDVPNSRRTVALGINNRGQVVGQYSPVDGRFRGFLFDAGTYTDVVAPDAQSETIVFDITDGGRLAGAFDLVRHYYLQDRRGAFTTIDHPDSVLAEEAGGINNRGQIVGSYFDRTNTERGFLRDGKGFTTIEVPGAQQIFAFRINDRGQVVGLYTTDGVTIHGYLWDDGALTTIDVPGAVSTAALDIDSRGRTVGDYLDAGGMVHGFLREPEGTFTTIDVPGAVNPSINGINERGQMTGNFISEGGGQHGFLLDGGVVTTIEFPGAEQTFTIGLNNRGQVLGGTTDGRNFVWENGRFTLLASPPGVFQDWFPVDFDDRGRILGTFR